MLHIAHVGSSRILVFPNMQSSKPLYLSRDHVPSDPIEKERILDRAKAKVVSGKIFSVAANKSVDVSRAFGLRMHKTQFDKAPTNQTISAECDYFSACLSAELTSTTSPGVADIAKSLIVFVGTKGVFASQLPESLAHVRGMETFDARKAGSINKQCVEWCLRGLDTTLYTDSLGTLLDELEFCEPRKAAV
jgi:serine/threonine protein phosphatase PrpC